MSLYQLFQDPKDEESAQWVVDRLADMRHRSRIDAADREFLGALQNFFASEITRVRWLERNRWSAHPWPFAESDQRAEWSHLWAKERP